MVVILCLACLPAVFCRCSLTSAALGGQRCFACLVINGVRLCFLCLVGQSLCPGEVAPLFLFYKLLYLHHQATLRREGRGETRYFNVSVADGWKLEAQYVCGIFTEGQDRTSPQGAGCRAHLSVGYLVFSRPQKLRINVLFPGQAIKIAII